MKHTLFAALATVLSAVAVTLVKGPSWVFVHQEDLPEEFLAKIE
ncbi:AgrD family cyclic lactone autoinducer peptide [Paenibacillus sp. NPDC057967]